MSSSTCRSATRILAVVVMILGIPVPFLSAQATGTVRGTVTEAGSRRPLSGAQVTLAGTNRTAVTGSAGEYTLANVPTGSQRLRATLLGFSTAETTVNVDAGQTARADLQLSTAAISLDALVVTGTPGATERRALGNAVTTINVAELTDKVANTSVTELLQSKAPGVMVIGGSGTAGAGSNIRIRGASSLNAGNRPVFYVDGVKIASGRAGNFLTSCCNANNGQNASLLDMINPEDIESIEVIKGPAAATLYGADAAGGVIQIITKKGKPGQQNLQWNAKIEMGQSEWGAERFTNYLFCDNDRINGTRSIPAANSGRPNSYPGCAGISPSLAANSPERIISFTPLNDPDALRTGDLQQYSLSVRGGGEGYSFYVSGDVDREEGIFHNNFSNRRSGRANFAFYPRNNLDFSVNLGYNQGHIRFPLGDESAQSILFNAALSEPGRLYAAPGGQNWWLRTPDLSNRFDNQTRSEGIILGATLNYRPRDWFSNRLTVGLDNNRRAAEIFYPPFDEARLGPDSGFIAQRIPETHIYTVDYAGTVSNSLTQEIGSSFSFGMQFNATRAQTLAASGSGLGTAVTRTVSAAAETRGSQDYSESNSAGFFAQEQLSWRERLYLTAGLRMDNNSVFGEDIQRIFYPKVSASWVVSEEPFFSAPFVDNLRLRAAWGQAGNAPNAYQATRTYFTSVATTPSGGTVPALRFGAFGNPNLKPERGTEIEAGFDASFFDNRAGIEFTYYNKRLTEGLLSVSLPPSSGFSGSIQQNLLETRNSGVELAVNGTPVESRMLTWESRVSLATNDNELIAFGDDRNPQIFGLYAPVQRHQPGTPLGAFWGRDVKRDEQGNPVLTKTGVAVRADEDTYVGPSTPTREMSFSNTFTVLGNLRLYTLLDYKGGHYMFNVTDWRRNRNRLTWNMVDPNVDAVQKAVLGSAAITLPYIQSADFVKLRDVSLTYSLPTPLTQRFGSERMSLTVTGHNMATLWTRYDGLDPEVNLHGDLDFSRAQAFTVPLPRRITASLNVSF